MCSSGGKKLVICPLDGIVWVTFISNFRCNVDLNKVFWLELCLLNLRRICVVYSITTEDVRVWCHSKHMLKQSVETGSDGSHSPLSNKIKQNIKCIHSLWPFTCFYRSPQQEMEMAQTKKGGRIRSVIILYYIKTVIKCHTFSPVSEAEMCILTFKVWTNLQSFVTGRILHSIHHRQRLYQTWNSFFFFQP